MWCTPGVCAAPAERGKGGVGESGGEHVGSGSCYDEGDAGEEAALSGSVASAPLAPAARARVRAAAKWGRTREFSQAWATPPNVVKAAGVKV
eukprot:scaffold15543_cov101-Isochrysis_galbana.AAC.1